MLIGKWTFKKKKNLRYIYIKTLSEVKSTKSIHTQIKDKTSKMIHTNAQTSMIKSFWRVKGTKSMGTETMVQNWNQKKTQIHSVRAHHHLPVHTAPEFYRFQMGGRDIRHPRPLFRGSETEAPAISTFSPGGLLSSNGLRMYWCVCACV